MAHLVNPSIGLTMEIISRELVPAICWDIVGAIEEEIKAEKKK